jgi:hypothetical protein
MSSVIHNRLLNAQIREDRSPFDAALYTFTAKQGERMGHMSSKSGKALLSHTFKKAKEDVCLRADVAPVRSLAREIKMMSLSPSVYGNMYSPLGTS